MAEAIVVCELLESGRVKAHEYDLRGLDRPQALEPALRVGRAILRDLRLSCWIGDKEQPASRPTRDLSARPL